jgi:hypothetical protein
VDVDVLVNADFLLTVLGDIEAHQLDYPDSFFVAAVAKAFLNLDVGYNASIIEAVPQGNGAFYFSFQRFGRIF